MFNRQSSAIRSIQSAIDFLDKDMLSEIIVVDDGSVDSSVALVESLITSVEYGSRITLYKHHINKGVSAAKNTGAKAARGQWIIFLDSDDVLIPVSYSAVTAALASTSYIPLHFFNCVAEDEEVPPQSCRMFKRNFDQYATYGATGEKLPIVNRIIFNDYLYDEDMPGYESLAYLRIIKEYGFVCIHDLAVRRYYTSHQDRLSSPTGLWKREGQLAPGHLRVISEHFRELSPFSTLLYFLRFIKSFVRGALWRLR
jgi:glycosyltransferase involved in cell wall biosynthesis